MTSDAILGRVTLLLRNRLEDLRDVQSAIDRLVANQNLEEEQAYALRLAVEELVSNVIRHGFDDGRLHRIVVAVEVRAERIDLAIEDDGRPFDPNSGGELVTPTSLEDAPTGGLGLGLVKAMVGAIHYRRMGLRNHVTLSIPRQKR